jgi:hypothetical protein
VARRLLLIAGLAWLLAAASALTVAVLGAERLMQLLPPLAIDTDAVGGAVTAFGFAFGVVSAAHVGIVLALPRRPRARSAAILLTALFTAIFVTGAAAAFTSAAAAAESAMLLLPAGVAAVIVAVAYGVATASFIGEIRSRRPS